MSVFFFKFAVTNWPCSSMDRMSDSDSDDMSSNLFRVTKVKA